MLDNQWYAVLDVAQIGRRPVGVKRFGKDLVVWRDDQEHLHVAYDACPHRGAALSRGTVVGGCLQCPYHGLRFGRSGRCVHVPASPGIEPPAGMSLHLYPSKEAHGLLWAWKGTEAPGPLPWDDTFQAELHEGGGTFLDLSDTFDVNYLRVMENLTDVHHVAHVHRWTAPVPAAVTAFSARREDHDVFVEATLGDTLHATIHLKAPFLAILDFAEQARFAVVVSPVDDENVWLFARYTQSVLRIPGLERPITWLLGMFDYRMLQRLQDLPVWRSQRLTDPADISRYTLLEPDEGVRMYFEIHDELSA